MPNSNGQDVKFSEDDESLIIQAEEGKLHHVVATDRDDSPHAAAAAAAACVHFSDSTIHNQAGKQQEQEEQQQNVNDDQDADAAARQALASDAEHQERDSSLRSDSNRTNVSWIPSEEEEEESSCSSEHYQQQQQLQLREQPLALPPPTATTTTTTTTTTTATPTLRLVRGRRKSNILARTISMSLRSSISSLQQHPQQQPTTCDICLMDYQVGEQVCWSPNDECVHCFHKDCMLDWLLRNPKCPVCRRNYLVKRDDSHEQQPQEEEETSQNARHSSDREFES
jgi:hypothetical protein